MINKNILRATGAAVIAMGTALGAHASSVWSVTTTGQISSGYDSTGVFGTAGLDLSGLTYSQTITASVDPAQWSSSMSANAYQPYAYVYGAGPSFTDTVSVGGHSVTFVASSSWGEQFLSNGISSANPYYPYDYVYSYEYGNTAGGSQVYVQQYAYSNSTAFVPSTSFSQVLSQNLVGGSFGAYAYFQLSGNEYAYFQATPATVSVSAVPESSMPAMLAAGLAVLGLVSRRKAAKAA